MSVMQVSVYEHEHHIVCAINVVMDATSASSVSGEVIFNGNVDGNG